MTLHLRAPSRKGERFSRERKRARLFLSRAMRACHHCTEKCVRQLAHICSTVRGSVRAATAGTVAPSHLLLKFGKLTIEFEMPFQFRKVKPHRCGTVAPSHLLLKFGKLTTKFELLCKETKTLLFQNFGRETDGAGGAGDEDRWVRSLVFCFSLRISKL